MTLNLNRTLLRRLATSGVATLTLTLAACDSAMLTGEATPPAPPAPPAEPVNLIDTAIAAGNFTTLNAALEAAGLNTLLADDSADPTYTVFAPTDAAFAALGQPAVDALLADNDRLNEVLLYHVLPSRVNATAATALAGSRITMQNGDQAAVSVLENQLRINTAAVITPDIGASNGIIHAIDSVLMPPSDTTNSDDVITALRADADFTTLVAAIDAAGLDTSLSDTDSTFTLFAPNNAAFAALGDENVNSLLADTDGLRNVLLYHLISGQSVDSITAMTLAGTSVAAANSSALDITIDQGKLMINTSAVTRADLPASNGIIHEIDVVLTVPADTGNDNATDLSATLSNLPEYSTLVSLLQSTGLDATLADTATNYTVFAPTNTAFAAVDANRLAGLAADADALEDTLLGHVIPNSAITAAEAIALAGNTVTTADGTVRTITLADGVLQIDDATVSGSEIIAENGIIHSIDSVLLAL